MPAVRLTGKPDRTRFIVEIDDLRCSLTAKSFTYLVRLAAARCGRLEADQDGWIEKEALEPGHNQARYIFRLKQELGQFGAALGRLIENDRLGRYRLTARAAEISFNRPSLARFPDHQVRSLFQRGD